MRSQGDMLLESCYSPHSFAEDASTASSLCTHDLFLFRMVLPVLLKLFPFMFELLGALASILVSDAFKRILDFLIQLYPS